MARPRPFFFRKTPQVGNPKNSKPAPKDQLGEFLKSINSGVSDLTEMDGLASNTRRYTQMRGFELTRQEILDWIESGEMLEGVAFSEAMKKEIDDRIQEVLSDDPAAQVYAKVEYQNLLDIAASVAANHGRRQSQGASARENQSEVAQNGIDSRGRYDIEGPEAGGLDQYNHTQWGGTVGRGNQDLDGPDTGMIGVPNEQYRPNRETPFLNDLEGPDRMGPAAPIAQPRSVQDMASRKNAPHVPKQNTRGLYDLEGPDRTAPAPPRALGVTGPIPGATKTPPATPAKPKPPKAASPEMGLTGATKISASIPTPKAPPVAANGTAAVEPPLFKPFMLRSQPQQVPLNLIGKPRSRRGQQRDEVKGYLAEWGSGRAEDKLPLLFRDTLPGPGEKGKQMYPEMARQDGLKRFQSRFGGGFGLVR